MVPADPLALPEDCERQLARLECYCFGAQTGGEEIRHSENCPKIALRRAIAANLREAGADVWQAAADCINECLKNHDPKDESGCMNALGAEFRLQMAANLRARAAAIRKGERE